MEKVELIVAELTYAEWLKLKREIYIIKMGMTDAM